MMPDLGEQDVDADGDGEITFEGQGSFSRHLISGPHVPYELCLSLVEFQTHEAREWLKSWPSMAALFAMADTDNSKTLSFQEVQILFKTIGENYSIAAVKAFMKECDGNNDGEIDLSGISCSTSSIINLIALFLRLLRCIRVHE